MGKGSGGSRQGAYVGMEAAASLMEKIYAARLWHASCQIY